jgi:hypothetical protein
LENNTRTKDFEGRRHGSKSRGVDRDRFATRRPAFALSSTQLRCARALKRKRSKRSKRSDAIRARNSPALVVADRLTAPRLAEAVVEEIDRLGRALFLRHVLEGGDERRELFARGLARIAGRGGERLGRGQAELQRVEARKLSLPQCSSA